MRQVMIFKHPNLESSCSVLQLLLLLVNICKYVQLLLTLCMWQYFPGGPHRPHNQENNTTKLINNTIQCRQVHDGQLLLLQWSQLCSHFIHWCLHWNTGNSPWWWGVVYWCYFYKLCGERMAVVLPPPRKNKIASQRKTHAPWHVLYLKKTKICWCEGEEGEEKVHLLTHATARGVGKNITETKRLLRQKDYWDKKITETKRLLIQKITETKRLLRQKDYLNKKITETKDYWDKKITETKIFLKQKDYWDKKITETKYYWDKKITETKRLLRQKDYWDKKNYWVKKITETKRLLRQKDYWAKKGVVVAKWSHGD